MKLPELDSNKASELIEEDIESLQQRIEALREIQECDFEGSVSGEDAQEADDSATESQSGSPEPDVRREPIPQEVVARLLARPWPRGSYLTP